MVHFVDCEKRVRNIDEAEVMRGGLAHITAPNPIIVLQADGMACTTDHFFPPVS